MTGPEQLTKQAVEAMIAAKVHEDALKLRNDRLRELYEALGGDRFAGNRVVKMVQAECIAQGRTLDEFVTPDYLQKVARGGRGQ